MIRRTLTIATAALFLPFAAALPPQAAAAEVKVATAAELSAALSKAAAGTTVQLAPGSYAGSVTVPAGVTLRGAGHDKTFLEAGDAAGITLGGDAASVAGLSVAARTAPGILARGAKDVVLSGVVVRGGPVGIQFQEVAGVRIENCVVDGSLTGIALDHVTAATIVNNTVTRADTTGIALADVAGSALFNNAVVNAGVGIAIARPGAGLRVDHNLYIATATGKYGDEMSRVSLAPWRDVSGGLDAASVALPCEFRDAAKGDYTPVSKLDWNPGVPTTAGWGVATFGDAKAPATDMAGVARPASPGLGAREAAATKVATDGEFTVPDGEGAAGEFTTSAGVFKPDGTAVRYLFRDLPLRPGTYGFVLPSRGEVGQPIEAGKYEVRLARSNLRWKYRMLTANNGVGNQHGEFDKENTCALAFGPDDSLIIGCGWSEHHENVASKDLKTGKPRWVFPGADKPLGIARGGDGLVYVLREASIIRFDPEGRLVAWPSGGVKQTVAIPKANGIAELDGILYVTTSEGDVVRIPVKTGKQEPAFKVKNPLSPVADRGRKLIWMVGGGEGAKGGTVTAYTPAGEAKHAVKQVANPLAVAVAGDRLAIADSDAGKVLFFDIKNPAAPVAKGAIGRGDGPLGPIAADRFWFQKASAGPVVMDLDETGRLAILDGMNRPIVFGADGKSMSMGLAAFGNGPVWNNFPSDKDGVTTFFWPFPAFSWTIDAAKGTWSPGAHWGGISSGMFEHKGRIYGAGGAKFPDAAKKDRVGTMIVRYDDYAPKPLAFYYGNPTNQLMVVHDENNDGVIDAKDGDGTAVLDPAGKPVGTAGLTDRFMAYERNGDIRSGRRWVFKGVDAKGLPIYEFPDAIGYPIDTAKMASPYSFETMFKRPDRSHPVQNVGRYSESVVATDGDLVTGMSLYDSPHGMGLSNSGCIDLARFRKDGSLRWYLAMNDYGPIQGVKQLTPGFILTSWGHQCEWIGLDDDGLSLGHLGFPEEAHWSGYWIDHPPHYCMFKGNDGRLHVLAGDYSVSGWHWLTLENYDTAKKAKFPFTVAPARAKALAAEPPRTAFLMTRSGKPSVVIKKLAQPLPIDGDLEKWRKLGLSPQAVVTPATGSRDIKTAGDCSGVIRMAYHGRDLYVQLLRFDDVVMYDPTLGTHVQDTFEMMVNGFHTGFQFCIGKFAADGSAAVRRKRFYANDLTMDYPADVVPRVVKVLDDAKSVPERKLVESATGEDLSSAKVIVIEFKLPIDERVWLKDEKSVFPVESGKGFWLGFMIDDNDLPGAGLQKTETWPSGYGTFAPKEDGVWVTFE